MKRKIQKLALRKETIQALGTFDAAVGGAETDNRTCTLNRTCYCTQDRTCTCTSETIC